MNWVDAWVPWGYKFANGFYRAEHLESVEVTVNVAEHTGALERINTIYRS